MRTSSLSLLIAAHGPDFLFLKKAQEFGLHFQGKFADLVEKNGSGIGGLEQAGLGTQSAGEGAFFVAEQFAFDEGGDERTAIDGDEGAAGHGTAEVQGAGDEFLAGAAFAGNEDGGARVFEAGDEAEDILNAGGIADDAVERSLGFGAFAEVEILFDEANLVGHAAEEEAKFIERSKGLGDVIVGAELHGLDRGFDRSVAGHDGDFEAGMSALGLLQEFDAGHAGHDHVGKDHVYGLFVEQGESGVGVLGFEAIQAQRLGDGDAEAADGLLVIDNQQADAEVVLGKGRLRRILGRILSHEAALPMVFSTTEMNS